MQRIEKNSMMALRLTLALCCYSVLFGSGCQQRHSSSIGSQSSDSTNESEDPNADADNLKVASRSGKLPTEPLLSDSQLDQSREPKQLDASAVNASVTPSVDYDVSFVRLNVPETASKLRSEAIRVARFLTQHYVENPMALDARARLHLMIGENSVAEECWTRSLCFNGDDPYAKQGLATVALKRGDYQSAVQYLENVAVTLADTDHVHHELADAYQKQGRIADSIAVLQSFVESHPDSTETYVRLGYAFMADLRHDAAMIAFEQALEHFPDLPRAQEGLARALVRLGKREKARELFHAHCSHRKHAMKNRSAEEVFKDELADFSIKYADFAKVLCAVGNGVAAAHVLEKSVILDSQNLDAWKLLISLHQSAGQHANAAEAAGRMAKANAFNAGAQYTSGVLHAKIGKIGVAKGHLRRAIASAPNEHIAYEVLARLYLQTRTDLSETIRLAEKAVEIRGIAADHELLAQAYAVNQRMGDATDSLARAIELEPENESFRTAMRQLQAFRQSQQQSQSQSASRD